jgi:histidine triad (HIT) family protein
MSDCVFCKIVKGELKTKFEKETKNVVVFRDIKPAAELHFLIVSKEHILGFLDIKERHKNLLSEMFNVARELIKREKIEKGYKLIFNGGKYQFVPHLHWHLLGGKMKGEGPI